MSTLEEHLEGVYDVDVESQIALREADVTREPAPPVDRFIIDDEDKANWALRKITRICQARDAVEKQARLEQQRIELWRIDQKKKLDREASFFESLLEQFHRNQLTADPSRKTIKLPAGTLKAIKTPRNVEVLDVDAFIEWAERERPEFVRIKREIERNAVKAAALRDGEILPEVAVIDGEVRYSVEVGP